VAMKKVGRVFGSIERCTPSGVRLLPNPKAAIGIDAGKVLTNKQLR